MSTMADGTGQARLTPARRKELIALLERRADVLRPKPELIAAALQACVRHDRRSGRVDLLPGGEASARLATVAPASAPAAVPTDVASAPTIPEQRPEGMPAEAGPDLRPGSVIEGYRIERLIGAGGMGMVYEATQLSMNRRIAFKVLSPRLADNETFRTRFIREARNAGRLQHPNLIAVHDVGESAGLLFFSMELVNGRSLGEMIKKDGALEEDIALGIARQALEGLAYAHEQGLVHRDIKPDNLMLTANGVVKIADLGLSRGMDDSAVDGGTTRSGTMMGTPYYMPPEQGRDAHSADHRADLYAVGATLYHLVCGKVPFSGRTAVEVVVNATTKPVQFPTPGPSAGVRKLIVKLMAKKAEERPASAREALTLLERIHQGNSTRATDAGARTGTGPLPGGRSRMGRLLPWLLGLGLTVAAVLAVLVALDKREREERLQGLRREVADLVDAHDHPEALSRITAAMEADTKLRPRAALLREEVNRTWNEATRPAVEAVQAEIEQAMSAQQFRRASDLAHDFLAEPGNASPAAQVALGEDCQRRLDAAESAAWSAVQTAVERLERDGQLQAARTTLQAIEPAAMARRREHEDHLHRLNLALTGDAAPAQSLADWFASALSPVVGRGQVQREGAVFRLRGEGLLTVNDTPASPDRLAFTLIASVPGRAGQVRLAWGGGRGMPTRGVRLADGRAWLERIPPLLGRNAPSLAERQRLRRSGERGSLFDGFPLQDIDLPDGGLRLRIELSARQAERPAEVRVVSPDFRDVEEVVSERSRPGPLLRLHWSLPEDAAATVKVGE